MTDTTLTEICPACRGARMVFGGLTPDGDVRENPCATCGGMGAVAPDDPSLVWADCPHCARRIRIEEAVNDGGQAHNCPRCGGFYHVPFTDDQPVALDPSQIRY